MAILVKANRSLADACSPSFWQGVEKEETSFQLGAKSKLASGGCDEIVSSNIYIFIYSFI